MKLRTVLGALLMAICTINLACKGEESVSQVTSASNELTAQQTLSNEVSQVMSLEAEPEVKAKKIVAIGEDALQSDKGFSLARSVFEEARKNDNKNVDAEFYAALLDVPMAFQGIVGDLREALDGKAKKRLDKDIKEAKKKDKNIVRFFVEGDQPTRIFQSETDLRALIQRDDDDSDDEFPLDKVSAFQLILEKKVMEKLLHAANRLDAFFLKHPPNDEKLKFRKKITLPIFDEDENGNQLNTRVTLMFDHTAYLLLRSFIYAVAAAIKIAVSYDMDNLKNIVDDLLDFKESKDPLKDMQKIVKVMKKKYERFLTLRPGVGGVYLSESSPRRVLLTLNNPDFGKGGLVQSLQALLDIIKDESAETSVCSMKVRCINHTDIEKKDLEDLQFYLDKLKDATTGDVFIPIGSKVKPRLTGPPTGFDDIADMIVSRIRVNFISFLTNKNGAFSDLKVYLPEVSVEGDAKDGHRPFVFSDETFGGLFPDRDFDDLIFEEFRIDDGIHAPFEDSVDPTGDVRPPLD